MKRFYDAIKTVYGPQPASLSPILSADGQKLLTEKAHILDRWAEHFDAVLNRSSHINEEAINRLPQNTINLKMGNPPTLLELEIASTSYLLARLQVLMQSQQNYTSILDHCCTTS